MTYCVGLCLKDGLVMLSDTRTNAGVDNVSTFSKMHIFEIRGERFIAAMSAGNLGVSQAVVNMLHEGIETDGRIETIFTVPSMFAAARLCGEAVRRVYHSDGPTLEAQQIKFDVSILLGGQLKGRATRLFQIYAAGNFIEATPDTPFLQIGETK
jgi:putative proteasome-type protease